jgi:hypothetical protein
MELIGTNKVNLSGRIILKRILKKVMGNVKWIHLPKGNTFRSVVNTKMNTCVTQTAKNFYTIRCTISSRRSILLLGVSQSIIGAFFLMAIVLFEVLNEVLYAVYVNLILQSVNIRIVT